MSLSATDTIDGLSLPVVTLDDLNAFHAIHFPPTPSAFVDEREEDFYSEQEQERYPDGTIRTLTDEQIDIFRHTEIQQFLAAKRRADEAEAENVTRNEDEDEDEGEVVEIQPQTDAPHLVNDEAQDEKLDIDQDQDQDQDDEAEYRAYLEKERLELQANRPEPAIPTVAPPQFGIEFAQAHATNEPQPQGRKPKPRRPGRYNERAISTRRKVRELDEIQAERMELDY